MKKYIILLLIVTAVSASCAVLAWHIAAHPWLIWHALPAGEQQVVSRLDLPAVQSLVASAGLLPPEVAPQMITAIGLSRTGENTTSIIVPRLAHYRSLERALRAAGWQTERLGRMIRVSTNGGAAPTFRDTITQAGVTLFTARSHRNPYLIAAHTRTSAGVPAGVLILTADHAALSVDAADTLPSLLRTAPAPVAGTIPGSGLRIAIQSTEMQHIPTPFIRQLNAHLAAQLGLGGTEPELIRTARQHERLAIVQNGDEAALAVSPGSDTFYQEATRWLEDEERRQRPITRPFRLPDGTRGEEIAPGERESVLAPTVNNCHAPLAGKASAWLCHSDRGTILATSLEVAQQTERLIDNSWHIEVGSNTLRDLCQGQPTASDPVTNLWCSLEGVTLTGTSASWRTQSDIVTGHLHLRQ